MKAHRLFNICDKITAYWKYIGLDIKLNCFQSQYFGVVPWLCFEFLDIQILNVHI